MSVKDLNKAKFFEESFLMKPKIFTVPKHLESVLAEHKNRYVASLTDQNLCHYNHYVV